MLKRLYLDPCDRWAIWMPFEMQKVKMVRPIDLSDFKDAISKTKKSATGVLLAKYDAWEMEQMAGGH